MTTSYATFDLEDLLREFGDLDTIRELVTIVRADLATYGDRLSEALAAGDYAALRETAHAIKGAVSNVSARHCRDLADGLDRGLKAGESGVVGVVPNLLLECHKLRAELGLWLESAQDAAH
jgi:HPt (histidine-containing phosphotransfer) domain-containing protein